MELIDPVNSQSILITIINSLSPESLCRLLDEIESDENRSYFSLCISFCNERKINLQYCRTFEGTCKSILSRLSSKPEKKVKKYELCEKFGWNNNVQMDRVLKGEKVLKYEELESFCALFDNPQDKRFWLNQLLWFLPRTCIPSKYDSSKVEFDCLKKVFLYLTQNELESLIVFQDIHAKLTQYYPDNICKEVSDIIDLLNEKKKENNLDFFGEAPYKLFEVITKLVNATKSKTNLTIEKLYLDELMIDRDTWYSWKHAWEQAEKHNFEYVPNPRMQRNHLIVLALAFELTYLNTLRLLQIGGYRFSNTQTDRTIIHRMIDGDNLERLKIDLLNNNFNYAEQLRDSKKVDFDGQ